MELDIDDNKVKNLSEGGKDTLKNETKKYVNSILKEADLIEEAIREDGAIKEINSNIILQASRKNKGNYNKKNKTLTLYKVISPLSMMVTGFLFDSNGYKDNFKKLILFVICLIIASVTTVMQFSKEDV